MTTAAVIGVLILLMIAVYFLFGSKSSSPVSEDDAKRFARLLLTEIKLYEQTKVERGFNNNNLYEVLFERIEEARKIYNRRVSSTAHERFFDVALIEVLANGDRSKLGGSFLN